MRYVSAAVSTEYLDIDGDVTPGSTVYLVIDTEAAPGYGEPDWVAVARTRTAASARQLLALFNAQGG